MNWLHYLLEANIYLAVFYGGYCLFLNKETHYTLNRIYLLLSCILSFILPVIQVGALKPAEKILEITAVNHAAPAQAILSTEPTGVLPDITHHLNRPDVLWCVYITGTVVMMILLAIKLFRVLSLTTSTETLLDNGYKVIEIEGSNTAFSFFNYLFIGTKIRGNKTIIGHELVHIRQRHSLDIIFLEVLKIINWFSPLIYLIQISIRTVHEYIADEQTATQEGDAITYSAFLVNNAYGLSGPTVTHSFFNYNLLKKRIMMLNKKRSGKLTRLKYLVALPVCAGLLCASTLAFSKNYAWIKILPDVKDVAASNVSNIGKMVNDYLDKNLRYPENALTRNLPGNITCLIKIDNSHHINAVKITESTSPEFYQQVFKCLNSYKKSLPGKAGTYALYIQFVVQGPKTFYAVEGKQKIEPYPCIVNTTRLGYSTTLKAGKQNLVL